MSKKTHKIKKLGLVMTSITAMATMIVLSMVSCSSTEYSNNLSVVKPFDKTKYLGKWYEISRTENRFQKGLISATATYESNDDGTIKVTNRAYDVADKEWTDIVGKAKFTGESDVGRLKVSFFGPFYGGYNVVSIDKDYQNVLIIGDSPDYMWILSRQKTISDEIKKRYLATAKQFGIDIDKLVWANHDNQPTS